MKNQLKKPIYKKWWFWTIIVLLFVGNMGGNEEQTTAQQTQEPIEQEQSNEQKAEENEKESNKEDNIEQEFDREGLEKAFDEIIKNSEGIILDIKRDPYATGNEWRQMHVVVSDAWYHSADHEKKRFAKIVGEKIDQLLWSYGVRERGKTVLVDFYDSYNEKVANEKIFGGYEIIE